MPRPEDTLELLARRARDDEALLPVSARRPRALARPDEEAPTSALPESFTRPISEAQQSSLVDAIQARLAGAERRPAETTQVSRGARRPTAFAAFGALAALAAAISLVLLGERKDAEQPLSRYELQMEGSQQTERGTSLAAGVLRLRSSTQLRFELRPKRDERGSVRTRAFVQSLAESGAPETRELKVSQEQSAAGALRLAAELPALLPARGELLLYVGRPSLVDHTPPNVVPSRAAGASSAQEFRFPFERVP
jgi:hypothetical protein